MLREGGPPLAAIVLVAAALRFATLHLQSFFDDELFTAWLVKMSFGHMLSTIPESEATPPLFYVLEWSFARALGTGEVGLRVLPALAGTLAVAAVYFIGAVGASRRVGLAAAAFVAVNPFLIWFSQEARAYSLLVVMVALSLACLVWHRHRGGGRALACWAAASAAALATHYFAVFLVVPEAVWLLWAGPGDLGRRGAAVTVPALAGVTLLPLALHQRTAVPDPGGVGGTSLVQRVAEVPKNFLVGFAIPAEALITALAAALALAAAWRALGQRGLGRRVVVWAGGLAACGFVLPLLLTPLGLDYVASRNEIVVLVPLAVLLACGFAAGRRGALLLAALAALSVVTVVSVAAEPAYQRRDWRDAAAALRPTREDRAIVLSPDLSLGPLRVYFGQSTVAYPLGGASAKEVALVALPGRKGFGPGAPRPPGAPAASPPPGFRRTEDVKTSTYRVIRYRAKRPLRLSASRLLHLGFPGTRSALVWQAGGHP